MSRLQPIRCGRSGAILAAGNNNSASVLFIEDVPDTIQYTCLGEIQELTAALTEMDRRSHSAISVPGSPSGWAPTAIVRQSGHVVPGSDGQRRA